MEINLDTDTLELATQQMVDLRGDLDAELDKIANDPSLSPEGKQQRQDAAWKAADVKANTLRTETETKLDRQARDIEARLARERKERAEKTLATLGAPAYSAIITARVEKLDPEAILTAYKNAPTDFEREAIAAAASLKFAPDSLHMRELAILTGEAQTQEMAQTLSYLQSSRASVESRVNLRYKEDLSRRFKIGF